MAAPMYSWCRRSKFYKLGLISTRKNFLKNGGLEFNTKYGRLLISTFPKLMSQAKNDLKSDEDRNMTKNYGSITYDIPTVPGDKKDTKCPLPKTYSPQYVEAAWYDWWVKEGFFTPEYQRADKKYVMCLPPPNVTGTLHLGHALTNSIQDAIIRWNRMHGMETLWIPGSDHAGIATQVVVEKKIWQEQGKTRHELGREKFVQEAWKWKNEKGDTIYHQMKRLGSSLDWTRSHFTMDEDLSEAVVEAFIRLHDAGIIYRSKRLVNWCCHLKSAISDIEVDNVSIPGNSKLHVPGYEKEVDFGRLFSFAYPVHSTDEEIIVSTTRPETMLGDSAVAVHPNDSRYTHLHGNKVWHPIENRLMPIVCDEFVDQTFGTGAVKITPDHDFNDFDVGTRHKLESITVIDESGHMTNVTEEFSGMKRFDARVAIINKLKELGLYRGYRSHDMTVPFCSRTRDVIEPCLMDQWYVNCVDMAKQAVIAIKDEALMIQPHYYGKLWIERLEDIRDWCISRQLWWGHRIPAYYASVCGQSTNGVWISARNETEALHKASKVLSTSSSQIHIKQDEDVLDTWFSSGLIPFSVLGWPNKTEDFDKYYPTSLLETGSDIWFFWAARMVMLGLHLTGKLPFSQVLLHGLLRDAHGRKMSKSLGNVIDPIDVINGCSLQSLHDQLKKGNLDPKELVIAKDGQKKDFPNGIPECGADALRFSLCSLNFKATDINIDIKLIQSNRHFCNKIWNGFKFVTSKFDEHFKPIHNLQLNDLDDKIDSWILSRLSFLVQSCDQNFKSFDLQIVTKDLKIFWINEFCDIYLEYIKEVFNSPASEHRFMVQVLYKCVDTYLRLASPFIPYLTEELYQRLPRYNNNNDYVSICVAPYPSSSELPFRNESLEQQMDLVNNICSKILSVSGSYRIKWHSLPVCLKAMDNSGKEILQQKSFIEAISILSRAKSIHILSEADDSPEGCLTEFVGENIQVLPVLQGLIDTDKVLDELRVKQLKFEKQAEKLEKNLNKKKDKMENYDENTNVMKKEIQMKLDKVKNTISDIERWKTTK